MTIHLNEFIEGLDRTIIGLEEFVDDNDDVNIDMNGIDIAIEGLNKMVNSIKDYESSL